MEEANRDRIAAAVGFADLLRWRLTDPQGSKSFADVMDDARAFDPLGASEIVVLSQIEALVRAEPALAARARDIAEDAGRVIRARASLAAPRRRKGLALMLRQRLGGLL